jgi:MFS family permease
MPKCGNLRSSLCKATSPSSSYNRLLTHCVQVFYWVGFDGITYVLNVFVADTSSLKNRAFITAITSTPYVVTTFIGPRAAQSFIETSGWRWGYGAFTIITPVIVVPIMYVIWNNQRKALNDGLIVKKSSGRTLFQSVNYYFWEFDGKSIRQASRCTANSVQSSVCS